MSESGARSMKFKNFLMKPTIKTIVIAILTIILGIPTSSLGDWNTSQANFCLKLIIFIVCAILYVSTLAIYANIESKFRRSYDVLQRQVNTFEDLIISIISICETNASDVNACIHRAIDTKKIDLGVWSFEKACRYLCQSIYGNICNLATSRKYGVAYVKLVEGDGREDSIQMIAYANQNSHRPSIFKQKRKFKNSNMSKAYCDERLFSKDKSDVSIYMGTAEVNKNLFNNRGRRHLYIGIPVFCDNKKMIGLLEVVGMDETMLGCISRDELEEITSRFLVPYSKVFLLLHKMEKALLVGTSA